MIVLEDIRNHQRDDKYTHPQHQYGYGFIGYTFPFFQHDSPHIAERDIQGHQDAPGECHHNTTFGEIAFTHG